MATFNPGTLPTLDPNAGYKAGQAIGGYLGKYPVTDAEAGMVGGGTALATAASNVGGFARGLFGAAPANAAQAVPIVPAVPAQPAPVAAAVSAPASTRLDGNTALIQQAVRSAGPNGTDAQLATALGQQGLNVARGQGGMLVAGPGVQASAPPPAPTPAAIAGGLRAQGSQGQPAFGALAGIPLDKMATMLAAMSPGVANAPKADLRSAFQVQNAIDAHRAANKIPDSTGALITPEKASQNIVARAIAEAQSAQSSLYPIGGASQ